MGRIYYSYNYSSYSLPVGTDDEGVEDVFAAEQVSEEEIVASETTRVTTSKCGEKNYAAKLHDGGKSVNRTIIFYHPWKMYDTINMLINLHCTIVNCMYKKL